jgi:hypothetical protein
VYNQILINAKLQIGKEGQKTELTGRSPQRRGRSTLDCSVIEKEEGWRPVRRADKLITSQAGCLEI